MTAVETLRAAVLARAFTHSFPAVTVGGQTIEHETGWRNYTRSATAQELNDLEDRLNDWLFGVAA